MLRWGRGPGGFLEPERRANRTRALRDDGYRDGPLRAAERFEKRVDVTAVEESVGIHVAEQSGVAGGESGAVRRGIAERQKERINVGAVESGIAIQIAAPEMRAGDLSGAGKDSRPLFLPAF